MFILLCARLILFCVCVCVCVCVFVVVVLQPFDNIRNNTVVSAHLTSNSDIVVGFIDGSVTLYDVKGNRTSMNTECSRATEHGELVRAFYFCETALMLAAYKNGAVHIRKCTQNVTSSHAWRTSCISLSDERSSLRDIECLLLDEQRLLENSLSLRQPDESVISQRSLEVWLGVDSDVIEVWSLSLDQVWMSDTLSQVRKVVQVPVFGTRSETSHNKRCEVSLVKGSMDMSMVAAVCQTPRGSQVCVGIFDAVTRHQLRMLEFSTSGMYVFVKQFLEIFFIFSLSFYFFYFFIFFTFFSLPFSPLPPPFFPLLRLNI